MGQAADKVRIFHARSAAGLFCCVEKSQLRVSEYSVFADELAVEVNLATPELRALDADEIPVDGRFIAIGRFIVALSGSQVEGACDFLVEEDVTHGLEHMGIHAEGKLSDVARALICVENLVESLVVAVAVSFDDFAVLEAETDSVEGDAVVDGRGVVGDGAVDAVAHGCCVDLTIGDVAVAGADDGRYALYAETKVCTRSDDPYFIRGFHHGLELLHALFHGSVIGQAAAEIEVLEVFGTHTGGLCHGWSGPGEDGPLALIDCQIAGGLHVFADDLHALRGDICAFEAVVICIENNVDVHILGFLQTVAAFQLVLFLGGFELKFFVDSGVVDIHMGDTSGSAHRSDELHHHGIRYVEHAEIDALSGLHPHGITDDLFCKLLITRIFHGVLIGDRVEDSKLGIGEDAILSDELTIEIDFPASVVSSLYAHHVPVYLGAVAVVAVFVGLPGSEVEGATDFLIEEDVAHGLENVGVHTEGKLTDVAGSFIGIEDLVECLIVAVAVGLDDFAIFEGQAYTIEGNSLEEGGCGVVDGAVHAVLHRCGEDLAVRDVHFPGAWDGGHALYAECQVRTGTDDVYPVGLHHACCQFVHGLPELVVVGQAAAEVEVLEGLRAHAGSLCHAGGGPAQHAPLGFAHAPVVNGAHVPHGQLHGGGGDGGVLEAVAPAANGDVGVHVFHFCQFQTGYAFVLFIGGSCQHLAGHAAVAEVDVGVPAGLAHGSDELDGDFIGRIDDFQQDMFSRLYAAGVLDEALGELCGSGVGHGGDFRLRWMDEVRRVRLATGW